MEDNLLEEGEIVESEPCEVSLSADQFLVSHQTREPKTICSDESSIEKSDDSDDDSDAQCSKPKKVKPKPQLPISRPQVPNKYKVWSTALHEEALMENLNKCDVDAIDRERSVESYNYKLYQRTEASNFDDAHMLHEHHHIEEDDFECNDEENLVVGGKRRHADIKKRLGRRKTRTIHMPRMPHLSVTAEDSAEDVANDIAIKLKESKKDLILNTVLVLGKQKAIELYNETKGVEDNGGMLLMNEERRRTPGGVFLLLLKRDDTITSDSIKSIFADDMKLHKRKVKKATKRRMREKLSKMKEVLIREKLLNLNTAAFVQGSDTVKQSDTPLETESNNLEEGEVELTVTNPPPSPATDQDTPPSHTNALSEDEPELLRVVQSDNLGRKMVSYQDSDSDYLDVDVDADDMDVF